MQPPQAAAAAAAVALLLASSARAEPPAAVQRWLGPQQWTRDHDGPIVSLGGAGEFDDTHLFAPTVVRERGRYLLWYCGSRGTVAQRVFRLGLATAEDGVHFEKQDGPVFEFGDGRHSVLTPTVLRETGGRPIRENGRLRMWFSSTWFEGGGGLHTLHETSSVDGVRWQPPSPPQLEHVYAPSVLKTGQQYQMWYTDVSGSPWVIRHASSQDGRQWQVTPQAALTVDQKWEQSRLFYPCVIQVSSDQGAPVYLMWYGSYWTGRTHTTALGLAVSLDGVHWHKHPQNPVLKPDPDRPWESHYVTSQSVIRLDDGSFRIWYASRKRPPFVNKYFALNTARWDGPGGPSSAGP